MRTALGVAAVVVAGTFVRLLPWRRIFTEHGVRFASDSDPYYHVLQAERLLAGESVWFDPNLNWPRGARVLWPPLFDATLAAVARAVNGSAPREALEVVAAGLPVAIGVLTLGLVVALGWSLLGRARGIAAGALLAVLPAHVFFSSVGVADQHVAEIFLYCAVMLAFVFGTWGRTPRSRWAGRCATAVAVAAAYWNWMGAAVVLALPVLFTGAAHVFLDREAAARRAAKTLAFGAGMAAVLLAVTAALWGEPGALTRGDVKGVTGLHVAITAGAAAFASVLLGVSRLRRTEGTPRRRLVEASTAFALTGVAVAVALPGVRVGVVQGIAALAAGNPWYAEIEEYRRLVFSCRYRVADELLVLGRTYGLTFAAAGLAIPSLVRRARDGERATALFLVSWVVPYLVLAFARVRFAPYAAIPVALLAPEGLWWLATRLTSAAAARTGIAAALAVVTIAPAAPAVARGVKPMPEEHVAAMRWLRAQSPSRGGEGVLATWDLGHLVRYFARKPVVASPFGTDGGDGAMVDLSRFNLSTSTEEVSEILTSRRVGFVVMSNPLVNATIDQGLVPGARPVVATRCSPADGRIIDVSEAYSDSSAARLFFFDGQAAAGHAGPAIGTLRLLYESPGQGVKVFGFVTGAVVTVTDALPSAEVAASMFLRTNAGREVVWTTSARVGGDGVAQLRIPYATGRNGEVVASDCLVRAGNRTFPVALSEQDVVAGGVATVKMLGR